MERLLLIALCATPLLLAQQETPEQANFRTCRVNLRELATRLEYYSADNSGYYPRALDQLAPSYLPTMPTCPQAGRQTYGLETSGAAFTVCCQGSNHAALQAPANFPADGSAGPVSGLALSAAEKIVAEHKAIWTQKMAVSDHLLHEQSENDRLVPAYRAMLKKRHSNLSEEQWLKQFRAESAGWPPPSWPQFTTPALTPEQRQLLENEKNYPGEPYLKQIQRYDEELSDADYKRFSQANIRIVMMNRWLRKQLGETK